LSSIKQSFIKVTSKLTQTLTLGPGAPGRPNEPSGPIKPYLFVKKAETFL